MRTEACFLNAAPTELSGLETLFRKHVQWLARSMLLVGRDPEEKVPAARFVLRHEAN